MQLIDAIKKVRKMGGDEASPPRFDDSELRNWYKEAEIIAVKSLQLLRTNDMAVGETPAKATITVNPTPGTISAIRVDGVNIITNSVVYNTNENVTAGLIENEINTTYIFSATRVNNVITITPAEGSGAGYNGLVPIFTQTANVATSSTISGGIDGIARISLVPNKKNYKISPKIERIQEYRLGSTSDQLCVRYGPKVPDYVRNQYKETGTPFVVMYGSGNLDIEIAKVPEKRDYIQMIVEHVPVVEFTKNSDSFTVDDFIADHLDDYVLFKMYSVNDYEIDAVNLSTRHLGLFREFFNIDEGFGHASNKVDYYFKFGDNN